MNKENIKKAAQNARDVLDGKGNVTPYPLKKSKIMDNTITITCDHTQLRNNINTLKTLGNLISLSLPVNPNEPNIVMINPLEFKFCYRCGQPL